MSRQKKEVTSIAISPDGKFIVTGLSDSSIVIRELLTGEIVHTLTGHSSRIESLVFSPDNRHLVSVSDDKTARIWDCSAGKEVRVLEGHTGPVKSVSMTTDGSCIITGAGVYDCTVRVWDFQTGQCLRSVNDNNNEVNAVAVSPDCKYVFSGHHTYVIHAWDFMTLKKIRTLQDHSGSITDLQVTPDGRYLISSARVTDKTIRVWSIDRWECKKKFAGHEGPIGSLAVFPDGKKVISGSGDFTARIWDMESGKVISVLQGHKGPVSAVAVSPDRKFAATSSEACLYLWEWENRDLAYVTGESELDDKDDVPDVGAAELVRFYRDFESSEDDVRIEALKAMGILAKRGANLLPVISLLRKALGEKDEIVSAAAAGALKYYFLNYISFYCRTYDFDWLMKNLDDLALNSEEKRRKALGCLEGYSFSNMGIGWKFEGSRKIASAARGCGSKNRETRMKSVSSLLKYVKETVGIHGAVPALRNSLADSDREIALTAAEVLARFHGKYTTVTYGYYANSVWKLKDGTSSEKLSSLSHLESIAEYDIVSDRDERDISFSMPFLAVLLFDDDKNVREKAVSVIRQGQGDGQSAGDVIPAVIKILKGERNILQKNAAWILIRAVTEGLDVSDYLPSLEELLFAKNDDVKFGVVDAVTMFYALRKKWRNIRLLLQHRDRDVRQEAAGTVGKVKLEIDISPLVQDLVKLLHDKDEDVRLVAARSLIKKAKNSSDIDQAVNVLCDSLKSGRREIRLNGASCLADAAVYGIDITEAVKELKKLKNDKHQDIRKNAARAVREFRKKD